MTLTPDGVRYIAASEQRVARPFHFRWLLPKLCGQDEKRWQIARTVALVGLLPAAFWYADGGVRGLFVAALAVGCSGIWAFNWRFPVLVDAPAMTAALVAAGAAYHHIWWLAILCALLAGAIKETGPIFAACWAWNPLLLVGLVVPAVRALQRSGPDMLDRENAWVLSHPFRASLKYHRETPRSLWVLPWGACLCGLSILSWPLATALAIAYGQCLVATDTVRLYQWAYPPLAVAAARSVDPHWWPVLLAVHLVNPFAGSGL